DLVLLLEELDPRIGVLVDPDHVLAELLGKRLRHGAHPSSADTHRRRSDVSYPCSRPTDDALYFRWIQHPGGPSSGWQRIDGVPGSGPAACSPEPDKDRIDVF